MKKILLTGATGYLGKNLLKGLLNSGYEVAVLVRTQSNISEITKLGEFKICHSDKDSLKVLFNSFIPDIIIHTAASYGRNSENMEEVIKTNLLFPIELLQLATEHQVSYFINTDTSLPKELNWYSRSKKQFLEWLEVCSSQINIVNLELEYFYGPGDGPAKFITYVLHELQAGKEFINFSDGKPFRDFIYIDDVVTAYLTILKQLQTLNGFTNIPLGSGSALMLKDLIIEMQQLTGAKDVKLNFGALPVRKNEIMHSCADITMLREMGWAPQFSFQQGIKTIIDKENRLS